MAAEAGGKMIKLGPRDGSFEIRHRRGKRAFWIAVLLEELAVAALWLSHVPISFFVLSQLALWGPLYLYLLFVPFNPLPKFEAVAVKKIEDPICVETMTNEESVMVLPTGVLENLSKKERRCLVSFAPILARPRTNDEGAMVALNLLGSIALALILFWGLANLPIQLAVAGLVIVAVLAVGLAVGVMYRKDRRKADRLIAAVMDFEDREVALHCVELVASNLDIFGLILKRWLQKQVRHD